MGILNEKVMRTIKLQKKIFRGFKPLRYAKTFWWQTSIKENNCEHKTLILSGTKNFLSVWRIQSVKFLIFLSMIGNKLVVITRWVWILFVKWAGTGGAKSSNSWSFEKFECKWCTKQKFTSTDSSWSHIQTFGWKWNAKQY